MLHPIDSWPAPEPRSSAEPGGDGGDSGSPAVVVEDWRRRLGRSSGRLNVHAPRYRAPSRRLAICERTTRSGTTISARTDELEGQDRAGAEAVIALEQHTADGEVNQCNPGTVLDSRRPEPAQFAGAEARVSPPVRFGSEVVALGATRLIDVG